MLTRLNVTNILGGRDIDNDTPFIIVSSDNIEKFLSPIKFCNPHTIYRIKYREFVKYVQRKGVHSIDMRNFMPIGDLCSDKRINSLLLANRHIVPTTNNYRNIGKMNGLYMWVGFIRRQGAESRSIGVVTTKTKYSPKYFIPVLPRMYLIKMDFGSGFIRGNDFDILSVKSDGLWIMTRNRFRAGSLYYGDLNPSSSSRESKKKIGKNYDKDFTKLMYNEHGQLLLNDKCITVDKYGKLKLRSCGENKSQQWLRSGNDYVSMYNNQFNKCIGTSSSGGLILKNYHPKTDWDGFDRQSEGVVEDWESVKGKTMVLRDRNNPWFLDKKILQNTEKMGKTSMSAIEMLSHPIKGKRHRKRSKDKYNISTIKDSKRKHIEMYVLIVLIIILLILIIIKLKNHKKN